MDRIFKAAQGSAQLTEESKDSQGLIEPFFSFDRLLSFFTPIPITSEPCN